MCVHTGANKGGEVWISVLGITTDDKKEFKAKGPEWKSMLKKEGKGRWELRFKEHLLYARLSSLREDK